MRYPHSDPTSQENIMRPLVMLIAISIAVLHLTPGRCDPLNEAFNAINRNDYAAAYKLLQPLAEKGSATAQSLLGQMYSNGTGVPKDDRKAVYWWRKAAERGEKSA
jgi:uncharacterized protein